MVRRKQTVQTCGRQHSAILSFTRQKHVINGSSAIPPLTRTPTHRVRRRHLYLLCIVCVCMAGIGRFTTEKEVDFAVELLAHHVERLRSMSPLWEMVQEGIDLKSIKWSQDAH